MGIAVVVVLLLFVMPALIYLIGWAVKRYTSQLPFGVGLPARTKAPPGQPTEEKPRKTRT